MAWSCTLRKTKAANITVFLVLLIASLWHRSLALGGIGDSRSSPDHDLPPVQSPEDQVRPLGLRCDLRYDPRASCPPSRVFCPDVNIHQQALPYFSSHAIHVLTARTALCVYSPSDKGPKPCLCIPALLPATWTLDLGAGVAFNLQRQVDLGIRLLADSRSQPPPTPEQNKPKETTYNELIPRDRGPTSHPCLLPFMPAIYNYHKKSNLSWSPICLSVQSLLPSGCSGSSIHHTPTPHAVLNTPFTGTGLATTPSCSREILQWQTCGNTEALREAIIQPYSRTHSMREGEEQQESNQHRQRHLAPRRHQYGTWQPTAYVTTAKGRGTSAQFFRISTTLAADNYGPPTLNLTVWPTSNSSISSTHYCVVLLTIIAGMLGLLMALIEFMPLTVRAQTIDLNPTSGVTDSANQPQKIHEAPGLTRTIQGGTISPQIGGGPTKSKARRGNQKITAMLAAAVPGLVESSTHPPAGNSLGDTTWVTPADVGLFCEAQRRAYCGVHALNAMASRPAFNAHEAIKLLCHPSIPPPVTGDPDCNDDGWFSMEALCKLLYFTTNIDVALIHIVQTWRQDSSGAPHYTREEILQMAPPNCDAFLVWIPGHYVCWKRSPLNSKWYCLDSIPYGNGPHKGMIRELTPADWWNLNGSLSTTVAADAYLSNVTGMPIKNFRKVLPPINRAEMLFINLNDILTTSRPTPRPATRWIQEDFPRQHQQPHTISQQQEHSPPPPRPHLIPPPSPRNTAVHKCPRGPRLGPSPTPLRPPTNQAHKRVRQDPLPNKPPLTSPSRKHHRITPVSHMATGPAKTTTVQADATLHNTTAMPLSRKRQLKMKTSQGLFIDLGQAPFHKGPTSRPVVKWLEIDRTMKPPTHAPPKPTSQPMGRQSHRPHSVLPPRNHTASYPPPALNPPAPPTTQYANILYDEPQHCNNPLFEELQTQHDAPTHRDHSTTTDDPLLPTLQTAHSPVPRYTLPATVGLYCQPQESYFCGAHALNAYIGSPAIQGTTINRVLNTTTLPTAIDSGPDAIIHQQGNWHITQLNRFLFLSCHQTATITHVLEALPGTHYSREEILTNYAPPNCTALIIHHAQHYKCWKQSPVNQEWYELDSLTFKGTPHGTIKRLLPDDWHHQQGTFYTITEADAFLTQNTGFPCPPQMRKNLPTRAQQITIPPSSITLSNRPLPHRLATLWTACIPRPAPGSDIPLDDNRKDQYRPYQPELAPPSNTPLPHHKQAPLPAKTKPPRPRALAPPRPPPLHPPTTGIKKRRIKPTLRLPTGMKCLPLTTYFPDIENHWKSDATKPITQGIIHIKQQEKLPNIKDYLCVSKPPLPSTPVDIPPQSDEPPPTLDTCAPLNTSRLSNCSLEERVNNDPGHQPAQNLALSHTGHSTTPQHANPRPPQQRQPPTQAPPPPTPPRVRRLKIITLNIRGLQSGLVDVLQLLQEHRPDITILTETKVNRQSLRRVKHHLCRQGYWQFHSTTQEDPRAGVAILVHQQFCHMGLVEEVRHPDHLQGYIQTITISHELSTPLEVSGVYMPMTNVPGNSQIRGALYSALQARVEKANDTETGTYNTIIAGDFNATLTASDRHTWKNHSTDIQHRNKIGDCQLHPLDPCTDSATPRQYTWRKGSHELPVSRIDDGFTNNAQLVAHTQTRIHDMMGTTTDHNALEYDVSYRALDMIPPPDEEATKCTPIIKLKHPLSKQDKENLTHIIETHHGTELHTLQSQLATLTDTYVTPYIQSLKDPSQTPPPLLLAGCSTLIDTQEYMERLGHAVITTLARVRDTVLQHGPTTRQYPAGYHYKPRAIAKKRQRLAALKKEIASMLRNTPPSRQNPYLPLDCPLDPPEDQTGLHNPPSAAPSLPLQQALQNVISGHPNPGDHRIHLKLCKAAFAKELRSIDKEHLSKTKQEHIQKQQALVDRNQKIGNQLITGQYKGRNSMALRVIETPDGHLETDGDTVQHLVLQYYTAKMKSPSGPKTGQYLPHEIPRNYPWAQPGAPDPFILTTAVTAGAAPRQWLHTHIADRAAFEACLKTLAHGKAPGPDGVTNEMLQLLPPQGHHMLHSLIQLMWATKYTPTPWKHSITTLMYKNKGTPLQLKYYRRIGLENTIYKLWTRMITWALSDFAERNNIISYTQGGFRNKRTTADQLELLTMILEDAQLTKQDIYMLMIDFTEAFDTIDHDKLLQTMYDLGFPTDSLEVVKNLYSNASTSIRTPTGLTPPMPFDRGTIQGDSLSPFLFILYLEPLMRWLRVGGNGYKPGTYKLCPPPQPQQTQHIPDVTYADDLNLLSGSPTNIAKQALKVTMFSHWGYLVINILKSLLTGAMYHTMPQDPFHEPTLKNILKGVQLQKAEVPFHSPKTPLQYLGVTMTMHLDWRAQFDKAKKKLQAAIQNMKAPHFKTYQKVRTLRGSIRVQLQYPFCLAPYTEAQLQVFDSLMTRAYKQAYGLSPNIAQAVAHENLHEGGLGCPSLQADYNKIQVQRLTAALNDPGPVGQLTRARMQLDKQCIDALTAQHFPGLLKHSLRLRQQIACHKLHLEMLINGRPIREIPAANSLLIDLTKLQAVQDLHPPLLLLADLQALRDAGIKTLHDLLHPSGRTLLTARQVALHTNKHPTTRQNTALTRIACLLTLPPGYAANSYIHHKLVTDSKALKHDGGSTRRTIHPEYARILRATHQIDTMDVRQARIDTLWTATSHTHAAAALDAVHQYISSLQTTRPHPTTSSYRATHVNLNQTLCSPRHTQTGYKIFSNLYPGDRACPTQRDRDRLIQLYHNYADPADIPKCIVGESRATLTTTASKKRLLQKQYILEWEPTLMQGWMIKIATRILGYEPTHIRPATTDEKLHAHYTECCSPNAHTPTHHMGEPTSPPASKEDQPTICCDTCDRWYHVECLPTQIQAHANAAITTDGPWHCQECELDNIQPQAVPHDLQQFIITWKPRPEPADALESNVVTAPLVVAHIQAQQHRQNVHPAPTRDSHAELQAQGDLYPNHPQRYNITIGQACREKLIIHPEPINPHTDIRPTGQHEVFVRPVHTYIDHKTATVTLACIYTPDGKCRHTLLPERVAMLYAQYKKTVQHKPRLMNRLKAGTFAEELYSLMSRYKDGTPIGTGGRTVKLTNHWATPREVYATIVEHAKVTKERFASPLNFSPYVHQYWSIHKRDQIFGAQWDTYKYKWTGSSVHNPEYEDSDLTRNVATAIAAARNTSAPVFGIHILPAWTDTNRTAYMKWLSIYPEYCKHLLHIPRKRFMFETPTSWTGGDRFASHPRWAVNLLITGNQSGFQAYFPYHERAFLDGFCAALTTSLNKVLPRDHQIVHMAAYLKLANPPQREILSPSLQHRLGYPTSSKYAARKDDTGTPACLPLNPSLPLDTTPTQLLNTLLDALPEAPPLLFDWKKFAYTDGSCKTAGSSPDWPQDAPNLGSGVYIPATEDKLSVLPLTTKGYTNTINRAELVALLHAIKYGATDIATDSLCSIHQIRKQMQRPQDMADHKHATLLHELSQQIAESPAQVHIWKVKSHVGIVGNEIADEIAKQVARGEADMEDMIEYAEPSNNRHNIYWPHEVTEAPGHPPRAHPTTATPPAPKKRKRPLENLHSDLKMISIQHCKFGKANRQTLYFEAWHRSAPTRLDKTSNSFMTSKKVTYAERKAALAYRYGCLYNQKLAHRYGHAPTARCLLCGQPDSGHHTASGCAKLKGMYIERHNKLGRLMLKEIARGRKGGYLVQMDLGSQTKLAIDNMAPQPRTIPLEALPPDMPPKVKDTLTKHKRPDALLYRPPTSTTPATYWIAELKCCRDSDPRQQLDKAKSQTYQIAQALQAADPTAKIHEVPLLVGVAGAIYKITETNLRKLGVKGPALPRVLSAVHTTAIQTLYKIYKTKLMQSKQQIQQPRSRKRK